MWSNSELLSLFHKIVKNNTLDPQLWLSLYTPIKAQQLKTIR